MSFPRNSICACGSGKRFKHCCGAVIPEPVPFRTQALEAHRLGALGRAESLYRQALDTKHDDVDVIHMLGVVLMQRLRYREALDFLWEASERSQWLVPDIRHNLALVLGKRLAREANARQADLLAALVALEKHRGDSGDILSPLVTVVIPAYNHERYVAQAIESVLAQTYQHIELIIIDDGSVDTTAAIISACLVDAKIPVTFFTRENRGAPATLNEAAGLARGEFLAFLNSDDYYAPDRIACLVEHIAGCRAPWGFSLVSSAVGQVSSDQEEDERRDNILRKQRNFMGTQPHSFTLVEYNFAISSGNLFVERTFFLALGGFREYRYNHDWDFCLRACARAEPVVVTRPLYAYRVHSNNTIRESKELVKADADRVISDFLGEVLSGSAKCDNRLAPHAPENQALLLRMLFRAGQGALVPVPFLRHMAEQWRALPLAQAASLPSDIDKSPTPKIALVVLGMHRSGTSAFSRVLNLCGAFLPAKLKPPKLQVNPKGFWEPEAVLELDQRVLQQLGGDWNRVEFTVPQDGEIIEEFEADAQALLASEYGDAPTILIKDPRICVLATAWHRVLLAAGYRPTYVVPLRNPLEVAQSLRARGDMSVQQGLDLWLAYMKRVLEFSQEHADVIFVNYTELLDDWRGVVTRIADRLAIPLDAETQAEEVEHFLEKDMRTQTASEESLAAWPGEPSIAETRSLYQTLLARCKSDAENTPASQMTKRPALHLKPPAADKLLQTATFVLCIENNAIRDQALLLCESIRHFGGRYAHSPILAFAPRPGLGVDLATRQKLAAMKVDYIDEPLNTVCHQYAPANRVFAGAYAEAYASTDFLVVLDSDTIWLKEPELPTDADAGVRPVDSKGSATRGPGDRFEPYWEKLAAMCGISLDRLPFMRSTIGNEQIRASYNAGLAVVRREKKILTRCADLFSLSLEADMRPYGGTGMNIFSSTGDVGLAGSEYWGSSQAALALAIWASTDRVLHYPEHYNVPLHLIAMDSDIDPRWLAQYPAHLHYHWMFGHQNQNIALDLLTQLGVPPDKLAWIRKRTPFANK